MSYFDELKTSLEDAVAFERGDKKRCRVAVREVAAPEYAADEIADLRRSLNLSQRALANALGVSTRTVEAWEAGRNSPSGAARNLLYLFTCDNALVDRLIVRGQ